MTLTLNRQWTGVESPRWKCNNLKPQPFVSKWGAPCGSHQLLVPAGKSVEIDLPGTDFSIAYVDQPQGGAARVEVDGREYLKQAANEPFTDASGNRHFMENRKGIRGLAFGLHTFRITATDNAVALLGVFSYDTRANRANERVLRGTAYPGETIPFTPSFKTRPLILCTGGLQAVPSDTSATAVKFSGNGNGSFEVVGE